ncbi:MAG: hypothetical protein AB1560_01945 [Pseudomonadota bacterium]
MKTSCPGCGCVFDLDAGVSDADARRFAELVAGLDPRVAKPLIQYLALFRPAKTGMRWSRMLSLAQELEPMIREARVTRKGTTYAVPLELWSGALAMLADRPKNLTLPLKSHGYLLEILANQAEKISAKHETQTEQQKRRPAHDFIKQGDATIKNIEHHLGELKIAAGKKP